MSNFLITDRKHLISLFVCFFIFDLLFMPNLLASTPLSFFLLIFFSPMLFSVKKSYLILYCLLVIIMLASTINGMSLYITGTADNVKRLIQMMLMLAILFLNFRRLDFDFVQNNINKLICLFVFYLVNLLVASIFTPELYLSFMSFLSPNAIDMIVLNVDMFRFSYMFSDPNTLGYLLVFISVYCLFYIRNFRLFLVLWFALFILVLSTQSRGALLGILLTTFLFVLWQFRLSLTTIKMSFFITILCLLLFFIFQDLFLLVIDAFEKRSEIEEAMGTGMGGGRDKKYVHLINNFNFNFFGVGYSLYIDGSEFRPHSDLIRLILSYGLFFFVFFSFLFIPSSFKTLLLLLSFSVPFLLNSVIDDFRLFGLFIIVFMFMKFDKRSFN